MFNAVIGALALAVQLEAAALLQAADAPRAAFLHHVVDVRVTIRENDKPDKLAEFELYVGGEDRQLVIFKDDKNKGRKFITHGDKTWLIAPNASRPVAITARQRLIGGASFADVARVRLAKDYTGTLRDQRLYKRRRLAARLPHDDAVAAAQIVPQIEPGSVGNVRHRSAASASSASARDVYGRSSIPPL